MTYDPNGNIRTLRRYDQGAFNSNSFDYFYGYDEAAVADREYDNRLRRVNSYVDAYEYDNIGRLVREDKKEGYDQYIEYDVMNRVAAVYSDPSKNKPRLKNLYDDRGDRLAKIVFPENYPDGEVRTTWYIRTSTGGIVSIYEQRGEPLVGDVDTLAWTEVPIYGISKLGVFYPQQDSSTAYELVDHLGNVRAIIRDNISVYTATMEDSEVGAFSNPRVEEMQYFENLFETEVVDTRMNHTDSLPGRVAIPDKSAYLYWVDGMAHFEAQDRAVGPSIALKVHAGDKISLKTWVRYQENVNYTNDLTLPVLAQLLGTDLATTLARDGVTLINPTGTFEGALAGMGGSSGDDNSVPRAFLNYAVFNSNWGHVTAHQVRVSTQAGFEPGEEAIKNHEMLADSVVIPVDGYVYIWVSNGSEATKVWFDDLTVMHQGVRITQSTDYGVWGEVLREEKADESVYRFGYQGQFAEQDVETGWGHFELREYDPLIGRWTSTDPYNQFYSPYIGMGNNPVSGTDADGGLTDIVDKDTGKGLMHIEDGIDEVIAMSSDEYYNFIWAGALNNERANQFGTNLGSSMGFDYITKVLYFEAGYKQLDSDESAGIYDVLENRSAHTGKSVLEIIKNTGIYGADEISRTSTYDAARLESSRLGLIKGMINPNSVKDYSGGSYFWEGVVFLSNPKKYDTNFFNRKGHGTTKGSKSGIITFDYIIKRNATQFMNYNQANFPGQVYP